VSARWVAAVGAKGIEDEEEEEELEEEEEEEEEEEDAYVRELISFVLDREPKKAGPLIEARLKLK